MYFGLTIKSFKKTKYELTNDVYNLRNFIEKNNLGEISDIFIHFN